MKPLQRTVNILSALVIAASAIGFIDATYLTAKYFSGGPIPCSLLNGCEKVTTSSYATLLGVPVALLGALFYLTMLVFAVLFRESGRAFFVRLLFIGGIGGFLFSLWLVGVQVFILDALCLYCLVSAGTSTTLFVLSVFLFRNLRKEEVSIRSEPL